MKIFNIVLTGGPCAGKTTAINTVKKHLDTRNIPCFIVPETATELIPNLVNFEIPNLYNFQKLVMKRQLVKESDTLDYVRFNYSKVDRCVILYDRGLYDNLAYLNNHDLFKKMLKSYNINELTSLEKYDMVIDLLSLATCKPNEYNHSNNARKEDILEASILDNRTSNAWANHPNLRIVCSDISLSEESKIVTNLVDNFIDGKDTSIQVEYLIDNFSNFEAFKDISRIKVATHTFLANEEDNILCDISIKTYDFDYFTYEMMLYKRNDNEKIIIYQDTIDTWDFSNICRKYKYLDGFMYDEVNFVSNMMLYKLEFYKDKTLLKVKINENGKKIIIPDCLLLDKKETITKVRK